jgi:hypothetical protein
VTSRHLIYALVDPRTGQWRYIGKTEGRLQKRLNEHWCNAWRRLASGGYMYKQHVYCWIRSMGGTKPEVVELEEHQTHEALMVAEMEWIAAAKMWCDLTNKSDGGEGCIGYRHDSEARRKISEAKRGKKPSIKLIEALRKLSDEQEREVVSRYRSGESMMAVGSGFGMSGGGVRKILIRAGEPRRNAAASRWITERRAA